jgi:hypothetical protein
MTRASRHTRFPHDPVALATAMADEPVLLDGLKVVFDEKVALVPVTLQEPDGAEEDDELAR